MNDMSGDVVSRATSADATSSADTPSARRWQRAVLEASSRTSHALTAPEATRDPRYASADPAIDRLWHALREVADPELPISLVDLGLVCAIRRQGASVEVDITFTATACPCMAFIVEDVRDRLLREPDVSTVTVHDVWDPPWTTDRMTDHGRKMLKNFGVAA